MKKGDHVKTPRFLMVRIAEIFNDRQEALKEGFYEPTHFEDTSYDIHGKHIGENRMIFAAFRKN